MSNSILYYPTIEFRHEDYQCVGLSNILDSELIR